MVGINTYHFTHSRLTAWRSHREIVFTESVLHTTLPCTRNNEWRTLFLQYSFTAVSWPGAHYDVTDPMLNGYKLTEQEIPLMEPPNARQSPRQ